MLDVLGLGFRVGLESRFRELRHCFEDRVWRGAVVQHVEVK